MVDSTVGDEPDRVIFRDQHWSLTDTSRQMMAAGLYQVAFYEYEDVQPAHGAPWVLVAAVKAQAIAQRPDYGSYVSQVVNEARQRLSHI